MESDCQQNLPCITEGLPGIGGHIKMKPQHFMVEEIPLYDPCGQGEHIYVRIARYNWNTRDLQEKLAHLFGLKNFQVGCAGLKDKFACCTQTFSVWLPRMQEEEAADRIRESLGVEVLWVKRHRNKLKTGHLLGNRFRIAVIEPLNDALSLAGTIAEQINVLGFPNYFGKQRFGIWGDNAQVGLKVLVGKKSYDPWLRRLLISAYQAELYNEWLAERIRSGRFDRLILGDIAKKTDTGGLFEVKDLEKESPRLKRREITYTGPIYGMRMLWATEEAGRFEEELLKRAGVTISMFVQARIHGSRRPARFFLKDLKIEPQPGGLLFTFELPKGAYATMVMREFLKTEVGGGESCPPPGL